jgi:hypothetical protein
MVRSASMHPCHQQNSALQMEASPMSMSAAISSLVRRFRAGTFIYLTLASTFLSVPVWYQRNADSWPQRLVRWHDCLQCRYNLLRMSDRRYRRYKYGAIYQWLTWFQGEANIYHTPGRTNCGEITLKADGCFLGCSPQPPPLARCPTNLNGIFQSPHLIIPIDSSNPNRGPGTSYFGEVTPTISSIFNFDIPASDTGKACSLVFLFPN